MTIGILISLIAILDRQSNLILLPSFSLAYLSKNGLQLRNIIYSAAVTITGVTLYILYSQWLKLTGRAPALYNTQTEQILVSLSRGIRYVVSICAENILIISIYLGLFLFPFLLVELSRQYQSFSSQQKRVAFSPALVVAAVIAVVLAKYHRMPLTGNVLEFFSLGTQEPPGYQAFLDPRSINLIGRGWQILTALGALGAALLAKHFIVAILILFTKTEKPELDCGHNRKWLLIFVISLNFASSLPIVLLPKDYWYDRYLIIFLPLMMMMVVLTSANKIIARKVGFGATCTSIALALFYGVFTISGTHDYLGSNRVRWQALNNLTQGFQLLPEQIDGKFEFNGWYFGNKLQTCNPQYDNIAEQTRPTWSDFKCLYNNDRWQYTVSFVRQPGFSLANEYYFRRWLPWREEILYLLHKNTSSNEQTR